MKGLFVHKHLTNQGTASHGPHIRVNKKFFERVHKKQTYIPTIFLCDIYNQVKAILQRR
jgi:hypothetical protein